LLFEKILEKPANHAPIALRNNPPEIKTISCMLRHRAQATELEKCCQFFVGSNDESLSVVAVRINNPDRSPVGIVSLRRSPGSNRLC
jgi:hypothetical protein